MLEFISDILNTKTELITCHAGLGTLAALWLLIMWSRWISYRGRRRDREREEGDDSDG
jgi:hypothetical protein